jgi:hypothetical protein
LLPADGPECYLTTANPVDIVLNYENTYAEYLKWTGPSAWTNNYNASRYVDSMICDILGDRTWGTSTCMGLDSLWVHAY